MRETETKAKRAIYTLHAHDIALLSRSRAKAARMKLLLVTLCGPFSSQRCEAHSSINLAFFSSYVTSSYSPLGSGDRGNSGVDIGISVSAIANSAVWLVTSTYTNSSEETTLFRLFLSPIYDCSFFRVIFGRSEGLYGRPEGIVWTTGRK